MKPIKESGLDMNSIKIKDVITKSLEILNQNKNNLSKLKALEDLNNLAGKNIQGLAQKLEGLCDSLDIFLESKIIRIIGKLKDNSSFALIKDACSSELPIIREAACESLGFFENNESIPLLGKKLDDKFSKVKAAAIGALGRLKNTNYIKKIVDLYFEHSKQYSDYLKKKAELALINIGPASIKFLIDNIEKTRDGFEKIFSAYGSEAIIPLIQSYESSYDSKLKEKILQAIISTKDPRMKPIIKEALKSISLRSYAVKALKSIDPEGLEDTLLELLSEASFYDKEKIHKFLLNSERSKKKYIDLLLKKLKDKETSKTELEEIINILADLDIKEALNDITRVLGASGYKSEEIRASAIKALQKFDPKRFAGKDFVEIYHIIPEDLRENIRTSLIENLHGENPVLLAQLGEKSVIEKVMQGLLDSHGRTRESCAAGLLVFNGLEYQKEDPISNFSRAFNLLDGDLKKKVILKLTRNAMHKSYAQETAVKHLTSLNDPRVIPQIIETFNVTEYSSSDGRGTLKNYEGNVDNVIKEMKKLDQQELEKCLIDSLSSENFFISFYAAKALAKLFWKYKGKNYSDVVKSFPREKQDEIIQSLIFSLIQGGKDAQVKAAKHLAIIVGKKAEKEFIKSLIGADYDLRDTLKDIICRMNNISRRDFNLNEQFNKLSEIEKKDAIFYQLIQKLSSYDFDKERLAKEIGEIYPLFSGKSFSSMVAELPKDKKLLANERLIKDLNSRYSDELKRALSALKLVNESDTIKNFDDPLSSLPNGQRNKIIDLLIEKFDRNFFLIDYLSDIKDDRIEGVLLNNFAQSIPENQEKIIKALEKINPKYKNMSYYDFFHSFSEELKEKITSNLIEDIKNVHYYTSRNALEVMSKLKPPKAINKLIELLDSVGLSKIVQISKVLLKLNEKRAIPYLIKSLKSKESSYDYDRYLEEIIGILADFGDKRSIEPIINQIGSLYIKDYEKIIEALQKLDSNFKYKTIGEYILSLEKSEQMKFLKRFKDNFDKMRTSSGVSGAKTQQVQAMKIFSELKNQSVIPLLKTQLSNKYYYVRKEAAKAIAIITDLSSYSYKDVINSFDDEEREGIISQFIYDIDYYQDHRNTAGNEFETKGLIENLSGVNDDRVYNIIRTFLDPERRNCEIAAENLAKIDSKKAIKDIIPFLGHRWKGYREMTIKLLGELDNKYKDKSFDEIIILLEDTDKEKVIEKLTKTLESMRGEISTEKSELKSSLEKIKKSK